MGISNLKNEVETTWPVQNERGIPGPSFDTNGTPQRRHR